MVIIYLPGWGGGSFIVSLQPRPRGKQAVLEGQAEAAWRTLVTRDRGKGRQAGEQRGAHGPGNGAESQSLQVPGLQPSTLGVGKGLCRS